MLTQGAFGLLTLLVASFLIVNLITAMLAGQTREIGVMKALGASCGQIAAMYFVFALAAGPARVAIAIPLAIAIGRPYAALKADMLNFSIAGFAIPWWAIALQLLVGCLLPVLAAAWPIARACRLRVSVALRDAGIAAENGAYLRRRIALPGLEPAAAAVDRQRVSPTPTHAADLARARCRRRGIYRRRQFAQFRARVRSK